MSIIIKNSANVKFNNNLIQCNMHGAPYSCSADHKIFKNAVIIITNLKNSFVLLFYLSFLFDFACVKKLGVLLTCVLEYYISDKACAFTMIINLCMCVLTAAIRWYEIFLNRNTVIWFMPLRINSCRRDFIVCSHSSLMVWIWSPYYGWGRF